MDFSALGMMPQGGFGGGGLLGQILKQTVPPGAPAVPGDGSMGPTIGPGAGAPPAPSYTPKLGLPQGGILGLMQGGKANGIMGLLQAKFPGLMGGGPLSGGMPPAGMVQPPAAPAPQVGMPGSPQAGPPDPSLPMNITPDNQF